MTIDVAADLRRLAVYAADLQLDANQARPEAPLGAGGRCVGQANPGTPPPRCGKGRAGGASRTMRTLRPSTQPRCANSWMKASSQGWDIGPPSVHPSRAPIRRIRSGCTLASTGHAAALPSPALNSRRRIVIPPADRGGSLSRGRLQGDGSPSTGSPSKAASCSRIPTLTANPAFRARAGARDQALRQSADRASLYPATPGPNAAPGSAPSR